MKNIQFLLVIICVSMLLSVPGHTKASEADTPKFLYPAVNSIVPISAIRIIGKTGDSDHLTINVKSKSGNKEYSLQKYGSYFQALCNLEKGDNIMTLVTPEGVADKIRIVYTDSKHPVKSQDKYLPFITHSKGDLTNDCKQCHPAKSNGIMRFSEISQQVSCITSKCHQGYDKGKFLHGPFEDGECVSCHNPHGTPYKDFLKANDGALCFNCHTDDEKMIREAKVIHFPVKKNDCVACHDPHKSEQEYHLKRKTITELCAGCHGYTMTSRKVTHAPVESGDCIVCHTPHVSEYRALLTDPGKELCLNCHTIRKEEFESRYVHKPAAKDCALCHDPHGSATKYHLRGKKDKNNRYLSSKTPIRDLCLLCHVKLNPEVAKMIKSSRIKHDPVSKDKCLICHTPHSTNFPKQLRQPLQESCLSCHKDMKKTLAKSKYMHDPVKLGSCSACHRPHGSDNDQLLRAEFSTDYTINFTVEKFKLCFNCHETEMATDEFTNKTGFRNGKKNLHYLHVHGKKGRGCFVCHSIHASGQQLHIREVIPFTKRFNIKLRFKKTPDGGTCAKGCHKAKSYSRNVSIIN